MIKFLNFPRTQAPPPFVRRTVAAFEKHSGAIGTANLDKGLKSDEVLAVLREDLLDIGFQVEGGKRDDEKIKRPVFFGENGQPELQYEVDGWHPEWKAGLEVEAARALMGNAVYRDLIQALVMVEMNHLFLAVPQAYCYKSGGRDAVSKDYDSAVLIAQALYGHARIVMPFSLCVIGY